MGWQKLPVLFVNASILAGHSVEQLFEVVFKHNTPLLASSYIVHPVEAWGVLSEQFFGTHSLTLLFAFIFET
jgi:hypothetical protein